MLVKVTTKNQITIPKKIIGQMGNARYFDVELKNGVIMMKPLKVYDADLEQIRSKIKTLGLKKDCVAEAIKWARSK